MTDQYSEDPSVSGMLRSRSLARQSGEYPTPPKQDEFPYQPGDFQRSRPQTKRTGVGESLNNFYEGVLDRDEQGVPRGSDFQTALLVAPGSPEAAIAAAPRLATGAGALYGLLAGTDKANSAEPDAVRNLQMKLRDAGFYRGDIDGKMGPGTQRANDAFMAAEKTRTDQEAQQQDRDIKLKDADARERDAKARAAETERKRIEDETKDRQRSEGNARMQEMDKNLTPGQRALRDYGSTIGYGVGSLAGAGLRKAIQSGYNKFSSAGAAAADAILAKTAAKTSGKVAQTNEFWRKGGGEVPFTSTPDKAPGFAVNPNASPLDALYKPSKMGALGTDAAAVAGMGGESAYFQYQHGNAQEEEAKAQEAASADPSEVNIDRLNVARDRTSITDMLTNLGRGGIGGYGIGAKIFPRRPSTPNMDKAESMKLDLEDALRKKAPKSATKAEKPGLGMPADKQPAAGIPPAAAGPAAYLARTLHSY